MNTPIYIDKVTFEQFNSYLIAELKYTDKKSTFAPRKYALNALKKYFKWLPFTRMSFASFIAEQKLLGHKNSTINRKISYAQALAKMLGSTEFESMTRFPEHRSKAKDILSWEEMDKISTATKSYKANTLKNGLTEADVNFRFYCLIRLLSETGCRIGEALELTWENIDGNTLTFENTKNGDTRTVVITPQLSDELRELPHLSKTVFGITSTSQASSEIKLRAKLAGINKRHSVYPHLFRHSVITNLVMSGAPIKVVMEMVGHKRLETTAGYINNTLTDMENMLYAYSGLWERAVTPEFFMKKALTAVTKLLHHKAERVKLSEDERHYLIKIPKNVFTTA